jgi:hypothetical protein
MIVKVLSCANFVSADGAEDENGIRASMHEHGTIDIVHGAAYLYDQAHSLVAESTEVYSRTRGRSAAVP